MIRVAIYLLFSILLLPGNRELSAQQSAVDADSLRREIIAILDDNELSRVERARSLRDRIATEEAAVAAIVAADGVMQLGSPSFRKRSDAAKQLIESGGASVGMLERGAKDDDLERATRCLEILVIFAKGDDELAAVSALQAIERLATIKDSSVGRMAAKEFDFLSHSDQDRAIVSLEAAGARLFRTRGGPVRSISVLRGSFGNKEMALVKLFPAVARLSIRGEGITDAGIAHLSQLPALTSVTLSSTSISDAGLETLASMPNLDRLSLGKGKYTNAGLKKLSGKTSLRSLSLRYFNVTEETVNILNEFQGLGSLSLSLQNVKDQNLHAIGKLSKIGSLSISESPDLSDNGFVNFGATQLRSCSVAAPQITDRTLEILAASPGISSLNLTSNLITDDGLEKLSDFTSLTSLSLSSKQITDIGVGHLAELRAITNLSLQGTQITDKGVASIANMKQMKFVNLSNSQITDDAITHLEKLPVLAYVFLTGTKITDEGVKTLQETLPNCKVIHGAGQANLLPQANPPAEKKPAEEKPAEEKPAEEKPAEEKPGQI